MLERYFIPIAPYLLMSAGLAVCTSIFYSLKQEIQKLKSRLGQRDSLIDAASRDVLFQIEQMRTELREAEERTAQLVPPAPIRSGLNLNTRTQALRMFRHGADEIDIASKLGLPRNEVKLLLKVHRLAASAPTVDRSISAAGALSSTGA